MLINSKMKFRLESKLDLSMGYIWWGGGLKSQNFIDCYYLPVILTENSQWYNHCEVLESLLTIRKVARDPE